MAPRFGHLVALLLAGCSHAHAGCPFEGGADEAPSAGCFVEHQGKVLLVETLSGQVNVPGGKTMPGESAQCAAYRESLEETGLRLVPTELLRVFDTGFHLYRCRWQPGSGELAPYNAGEITRAWWGTPQDFQGLDWRYPGQGEILRQLVPAPRTSR